MWNIVIHTFIIFVQVVLVANVKIADLEENVIKSAQNQPYKHVLKRYDQDYQTCLENFEIRNDKIIRTQDSREMGAKYITEFDLSSREECLRACCGTETCDVFVFEEKNPGSCYLFHCGPADDFKCKFTKHHNYTSAILQSNRHLSELESQIKLTKHEQELTRLRKPDLGSQSTGSPILTTLLPGPEKETMIANANNANISTNNRHCSSYQFHCRGSNECIAIYNACDGIPQCADGSDEAPELDCPTQGTTAPPAIPPLPPRATMPPHTASKVAAAVETLPSRNTYANLQDLNNQPPLAQSPLLDSQQQLQQQHEQQQQQQQLPLGYSGGQQPFRQPPPQGWPQPVQPLPPQAQQYPSQHVDLNALNNQQKLFGPGSNQALPGKMYGREGEGPASTYNTQWNNYQHGQNGNQYAGSAVGGHAYEDGNSHIFNHKGNSLVSDTDSAPSQYMDISRNEYNAKYAGGNANGGLYYNNNNNNNNNNNQYRQPIPPNNWPLSQQGLSHDMNPSGNLGDILRNDNERKLPLPSDYYYEDSMTQEGRFHPLHENEPHPYHHPALEKAAAGRADSGSQLKAEPKQTYDSALESKLEQDLSAQSNKGSIDFHVKPEKPSKAEQDATTQASKPKTSTSLPVKNRKEEVAATDARVSLAMEAEDGEVSKPKGAILSLSLGMCICAIFMALVSCRVRMIRKRLRRGGKSPYTHDADYLVNGMYL